MRLEKQKGPDPLAGGAPGGGRFTRPDHSQILKRHQGAFLSPKLAKPRHVDLTPADRGRLHDLYVALHRVINAGRPDLSVNCAGLAADLVANGGAR